MLSIRCAAMAATAALLALGGAAGTASAQPSDTSRGGTDQPSLLAKSKRHTVTDAGKAAAAHSPQARLAAELSRINGDNRYATAVAISQAHFPEPSWQDGSPVSVVTVASGTNFPDALAGGPLAAGLGPLLLVPATGTVPNNVMDEIRRLQPEFVRILGGTGAVSAGVEQQLSTVAPNVERVQGLNRFGTAAQAAVTTHEVLINSGLAGADTIVISSGVTFADALAGGSSAADRNGALMLTKPSSLPEETADALEYIQPSTVDVLGGTGAVSNAVISQIRNLLPGATVTRVFGDTRDATAAALSKRTFATGDETNEVFLTNGWNYPDALAATPLAWYWSTSVLLSRQACVPAASITENNRITPDYRTAIGGTGVVSDAALALKPC